MITIRTQGTKGLVQSDKVAKDCWVDVRNATKEDLSILEKDYKILGDHLMDIMDIDEQSRVEKEDDYTIFIIRVPIFNEHHEIPHFTVPVGIILFSDMIVTVCQTDCEVIEDLLNGKSKGFSSQNRSASLLHFFGRSAIIYLRFLKDINRKTAAIEKDLMASVKNNELIQLLALEKSLVYFTTSLKSNEILLEKLQNSKLLRFKEDETELLEDVLNDNKQAIEMANIYSDILSGMMDAFASVISNNLNVVMRRLTTISVIFMPLNLLAGMGGMSEFSSITQGIPYWISYPLFLLGLIPVASFTYLILKGTGPSEFSGRISKKKRNEPTVHP